MKLLILTVALTIPMLTFSIFIMYRAIFNEVITNSKVEMLSYILYSLIAIYIGVSVSNIIVVVIIQITMLFLISLNYKGKILTKFIWSIIVFTLLYMVEMIVSSLFLLLTYEYLNSEILSISYIVVMRISILVLSYIFYQYKNNQKNDVDIPNKYYLIIIFVLIGSLYLYINYISYVDGSIYDIITSSLIVLCINIAVSLLYYSISKSIIAINERDIMNQQNQSYINQMNIINQSIENSLILKHDIKNQLFMIKALSLENKNSEINEYINSIVPMFDNNGLAHSNNFVIDSIINFKLYNLKSVNVEIVVEINVPKQLNISGYDITVILGNLLDNTIEALMFDHENKSLKIIIKYSKQNLLIYIENSFNGIIIKKQSKYVTIKANNKQHGIGLNSIEKTLSKYGGHLQINSDNKLFCVDVLIPLGK